MPVDVKDDLQVTLANTDYPSAEGNLLPSRVRSIRRIQGSIVTLDRVLPKFKSSVDYGAGLGT